MHIVEFSWFFCQSVFTWNQFWPFQKCKISIFNTIRDCESWFFMNFCTFWRLKFTKLTRFLTPKIAKTLNLELLESPKLISRKIWSSEWQKNLEKSTPCDAIYLFMFSYKSRARIFARTPNHLLILFTFIFYRKTNETC